jgi:Protein of unknown function (DUF992)
MTIVGVDVGFTTGSAIVWGVFTDTNRFAGMLTGTYVGATAQATAVAGIGANALVGGSNHSVALQPLSVQGQVGLNAAGGIGALDLHYAQWVQSLVCSAGSRERKPIATFNTSPVAVEA